MHTSDELYPPVQYGWVWVVLAIGILLLLVLAAILVAALTRPLTEKPDAGPPPPHTAQVIAELRYEYQSRLQAISDRYTAGELDGRQAHTEISQTVRAFVNEYSGIETPVFSLSDLRQTQRNPALAEAVGQSYPSIFAREAPADPGVALAAAQQVVAQWY